MRAATRTAPAPSRSNRCSRARPDPVAMRRDWFPRFGGSAAAMAVVAVGFLSAAQEPGYRQWSAYGGGPEQIRYSSLRQINRTNVKRLQVAWTYDTGETGALQTQPI